MKRPLRVLAALGLLASCGCGAHVVDDDRGVECLRWQDSAHVLPDAGPTAGLSCAPAARIVDAPLTEDGGSPVPESSPWTREDVCTASLSNDTCPGAAEIVASLEGCFEKEEGAGCDTSAWGGACERTRLWSLCGPVPATTGGCCYEAIVISYVILE